MRSLSILIVTAAFALSSHANAQPKGKPKPATQADIERLEKKIEAQQKIIDELVKLNEAMAALFGGGTPPTPPVAVVDPPKPDKVAVEVKPDPKPVVEKPRPPVEKPKPVVKKPEGMGTVVGKIAGVADAIVYVQDIVVPVKGNASMRQEGKKFLPSVLVVTKGTTVEFPNRDAIFHNVFSLSPDHSFDLGSYRQGETKSVTMSKAGVVTVYCNMHPQMVGHILVVPNPNYVRAGKDGFFRMPNVPAGKHKIVAWAPNAKPVMAEANVVDGEVVTVELVLKKGYTAPHTKKDGLPYGSYDK
jgi:plastocyanin